MCCPFSIKLRASQDGDKLIVTSVNDEHNHDVSEATFRHLPHQRKMNAQQKEQVKTMLQMNANKKLVQQHIRKETG
ncbi:hypothetical protein PoB_000758000 [Plakobranchus ocellatus]|uniref:FAR1 domain-containing protein n=1 Tax=Plakobranchus ocellatus TaxID=259542 RepID=A0AAV3YEB3_9GAST|nr:hypothetical protein PoB_000758000 [Plakobranchus ocellatus]